MIITIIFHFLERCLTLLDTLTKYCTSLCGKSVIAQRYILKFLLVQNTSIAFLIIGLGQ